MSGTSLDGIDAALVRIEQSTEERVEARLEAFRSTPYEPDQRQAIRAAIAGGAAELCRLHVRLGGWFADAAIELLAAAEVTPASVAAIGSHGQTVWHQPPGSREPGGTLQLGAPAVIAERIGVPVISDFRARDMAAGGQGAPLVPLVDRLLFSDPDRSRALQNIGGIANVSFLPPAGSAAPVVAFDTGPGVVVIDRVVETITGGAERFDEAGRRAKTGAVHEELLAELLADPYFGQPPPKSTGRERFGDEYARALVRRGAELWLDDADLVATATALTARSIGQAYRRHLGGEVPDECVVSGGGSRNPTLMAMLVDALAPIPVRDLGALGWDPDAKEAVAFAVLAHRFMEGEPGNLPSVTGARGPRVLGSLTPP